MDSQDELKSLQELFEAGGMSAEEFEERKAALTRTPPPSAPMPSLPPPAAYAATGQQTNQWAMILHLSQFAGYLVPFAGLIAPIVIWQVKKNDLPGIDAHGKVVMNWILSALIYGVVSFLLTFILIGIPMIFILGLLLIIFPIIGGIKANNGEVWKYPLSIPFFK